MTATRPAPGHDDQGPEAIRLRTTRTSPMTTDTTAAVDAEAILARTLLDTDRRLGKDDPLRAQLHARVAADCAADGIDPRDIAIAILTTRLSGPDAPNPHTLGAVVALARDYGTEGLVDAVIGSLGVEAVTAVRSAARRTTP